MATPAHPAQPPPPPATLPSAYGGGRLGVHHSHRVAGCTARQRGVGCGACAGKRKGGDRRAPPATHLLELLEEDEGEAVAGGEADVGVVPPRVGVLADLAAAHPQQPRRVDVLRSTRGEAVRRGNGRRPPDLKRVPAWQVSTRKRISLYRPFSHICAMESAMSLLDISSESWNFKNSSPPCPVI
jgi:hypothetical protein